ncbi:di-trans,poly-cis-decaprenylcistransferase [Patescibacteria group bacterium]|nr:di-trans,poly-cis-decaprenylcistransferase [Patescibacteria group bacterium]
MTLPTCIGFIMDGNRRWAEAQGKERLEGHAAGVTTFEEVVRMVVEKKIPHAVFYAFSTENWKRSQVEVEHLLGLFERGIQQLKAKVQNDLDQVRVRFLGRRSDFGATLQRLMTELETESAHLAGTTIWVALSYGGQAELLAAVNAAIVEGKPVDEEAFKRHLWGAELPDVDLLIRTSGEHRLSNFLPWQTAYSELFFTPTHWPAFTKDEFERILTQYAERQRRLGA